MLSGSLYPLKSLCKHSPHRAWHMSAVLHHENPLVRSRLYPPQSLLTYPQGLPKRPGPAPQIPRRGGPIQRRPIPHVKKVVAVASGKGGVGKSTVAGASGCSLPSGVAHNAPPHSEPRFRASNAPRPLPRPAARRAARPRHLWAVRPKTHGPRHRRGATSHRRYVRSSLQQLLNWNPSLGGAIIPLTNHGMPCMSMGFLLPRPSPDAPSNVDTAVVWRGLMVQKAVQQLLFDVDWRDQHSGTGLDVLVVDMPPGTGDVPLTLGQLVQVDGAR